MNMSTVSPENITVSQIRQQHVHMRNRIFGGFGMLINLMAVVILWMTRHIRPPLKVTLISITLSDLLFTTFAAFWRPTFPCWPALYFITSTILVSYFCTAAIALYNHIAVFHPFRCKEIFTLRRSIVAAASCWLGGLILSLACLDVYIPAEPTCFAASNIPRYGLVTVSSVCLICSCFIIVANVRVLFNIRRRSPITGRDGAPIDATLQGNRDTPKASNVKLWSTRTSCSIPIPSSTPSMSKNYRAQIKPPVTCQNVIVLERNRIAQPGASEETNTRDRNHLQVPRTHRMSHNCKYSSQAYIEANASLEISAQNDEHLIRSSKKPLKVITHINNAFLLSLDPIANAIYFHKVTEEDEKPDIQIEKDITTHTDAIVSLLTRQVPETVSRKEILLDRVSNLEESQTNMNVERTASLHKLERLSTEYPDICEPRRFSDSHDTTRDLSTIELEHSDFFNSMPPPSSRATETSTPAVSTSRSTTSSHKRQSWRRRTQNTLLILCSMCCLISLPYVVYGGYMAVWVEDRFSFTASTVGIFISSLASLNSITNPLLYVWRFIEWRALWRGWRTRLTWR